MAIHSDTDWMMAAVDDRQRQADPSPTVGPESKPSRFIYLSEAKPSFSSLRKPKLPAIDEQRSSSAPAGAASALPGGTSDLSGATSEAKRRRSSFSALAGAVLVGFRSAKAPPSLATDLLGLSSSEKQTYTGAAVVHAEVLAKCAWGGQIILTQAAWDEMGDSLPSGTHVLSLGTHTVDGSAPMVLMELVPNGLRTRSFPSIMGQGTQRSKPLDRGLRHGIGRPDSSPQHEGPARPLVQQLAPGFRDSPDPTGEMAIVFVATKLPAVAEAVRQKAVEIYGDRLRGLLNVHAGYECKEPEPCKFTLAFRTFEGAVRFSAGFHLQLLEAPWPQELLTYPGCEVQHDHKGEVIFRGLRARIGIAFGKPTSRKPLGSGRADYFGPLANLAARVMGSAAYGQTLLEASAKLSIDWTADAPRLVADDRVSVNTSPAESRRAPAEGQAKPHGGSVPLHVLIPVPACGDLEDYIAIRVLGRFGLKGVPRPPVLAEALPRRLVSGR
jgi:class 3 adenylate cyclase